jgi:hypothetical protein
MAITITRTGFRDLDAAGIRLRRVLSLALDAAYPNTGVAATSGYAFTPGDAKLGVIEEIGDLVFWDSGANIRIGVYDFTNQRLRIFIPNTGAEVANGIDLSTYTSRVEVIGK